MGAFAKYAEQFKKKENTAVSKFKAALRKQMTALNDDKLNQRSWTKVSAGGHVTVTLGKLEGEYEFDNTAEAYDFLKHADDLIATDADFIAEVEAAYGEAAEKPARKPRKAKANDEEVQTRKSADL